MTKQIKVSEETHKKLMTIKEQQQCSSIDETIQWLINQPSNLYNYLKEIERLDKRLHEILDELYCKDRRLEELGESIEYCDNPQTDGMMQ